MGFCKVWLLDFSRVFDSALENKRNSAKKQVAHETHETKKSPNISELFNWPSLVTPILATLSLSALNCLNVVIAAS